MPIRPVLQLGDPLLRQRALAVEDPAARDIGILVEDLADTLAHWRSATGYGRGIAAPQLGVLQRVIFLKLPGAEPWPLINPEIIECSEEKIVVWDACLSFLSIFVQVERHREITVHGKGSKTRIAKISHDAARSLDRSASAPGTPTPTGRSCGSG